MDTKRPKRVVREYSKHGLHTMKRALKHLGSRSIDMRTKLGKRLTEWRCGLVEDLGGPDAVSMQQIAVVDLCLRTRPLLDSVDAWLLSQPSLINKTKRALLPIVLQRQQLADSLARYLGQLGLERKSKPVLSLPEYLESRYGRGEEDDGQVETAAQQRGQNGGGEEAVEG